MAYRKYNLGGREMLNLDNYGMVDYNEYYSLWHNSNERRSNISDKFLSVQKSNMLENEPTMNYSVQYQKFLEENNQIKNDKLLLFLAEIRYNQLGLKLTKDSLKVRITKLSKNNTPNFIRKWFIESRILMYKTEMDIANKKLLQMKLNQNARERKESFEDASKKILK